MKWNASQLGKKLDVHDSHLEQKGCLWYEAYTVSQSWESNSTYITAIYIDASFARFRHPQQQIDQTTLSSTCVDIFQSEIYICWPK